MTIPVGMMPIRLATCSAWGKVFRANRSQTAFTIMLIRTSLRAIPLPPPKRRVRNDDPLWNSFCTAFGVITTLLAPIKCTSVYGG